MLASSPLPDLAIAWIHEDAADGFVPQYEQLMRSAITRFCCGAISIEECKASLPPFVTATHAIDRLYAVLGCRVEPVHSVRPSKPGLIASRRRRCKQWTDAEDNRLLCAIHHYGIGAWPPIAAFVGNDRTRAQCAQRWFRVLDPRICKDDWTAADDKRLVRLVLLHGEAGWTYISREMQNRSDVQCRYRYLQLKRTGQDAQLVAAMAAGPQMLIETADDAFQKQLSKYIKKKGRPMKSALVSFNAAQQVPPNEDGSISSPPTGVLTSRINPTAPANPMEALIDWNFANHDEASELMSW
jgi:hypothetical protein